MVFFESTAGETLAFVLSACIIGVASYILNKNRQFYKKVTQGLADVVEVKEALTGAPQTELNPYPAPGVLTRLTNVEHLLQNGLHADVRDIRAEQERVRKVLEAK